MVKELNIWLRDALEAADCVVSPRYFVGKTVAVLGATGFIGSILSYTVAQLGATVIACGRNKTRLDELFVGQESVKVQEIDVTNAYLHFYTVPQIIINAASPADPQSFVNNPVQTMLSNINGVKNVLDYAVEHHVEQVLYVSSGEIYGYFLNEHLLREEELGYLDLLSSRSCYPQSKRAAETLCASYAQQFGIDVRVARPSHVLGPQFTQTDSRASAQFFRDSCSGRDIELTSAGTQIRTFVYISDCVAGILSILSAGEKSVAYNVSNSAYPVSFADFARAVGRVGGVQVHIPQAEHQINQNQSLKRIAQLGNTRLMSLGWSPQINFESAVERTFALLRSNDTLAKES